jgi:hypothetical protein
MTKSRRFLEELEQQESLTEEEVEMMGISEFVIWFIKQQIKNQKKFNQLLKEDYPDLLK